MPIHLVKLNENVATQVWPSFLFFSPFLLSDTTTIYHISFAQVPMSQFIKLAKKEIKL
jgi:hypothetical protein